MYTDNQKTIYIIVNKKHELGTIANAACHLIAGITNNAPNTMEFHEYTNKSNSSSANISHHPIVVLQSKNSSQLVNILKQTKDLLIPYNYFTSTMIGTSAEVQKESTYNTEFEELDFIGVALFGDKEKLTPITKKFSILK